MCLSTTLPLTLKPHICCRLLLCCIFALWTIYAIVGPHGSSQETHSTDSQPGSGHHFISIQLIFIKQLLCARQWAHTDQSNTVSALKIFSAHNILKVPGYLWVEYFCVNGVFPDTTLSGHDSLFLLTPDYARPVSQGEWQTQWVHSWKSQSPKAQDCGHLAPQMGHQGDGYIANGSDSQIMGTNNAWVCLAFPVRTTWKRMPA